MRNSGNALLAAILMAGLSGVGTIAAAQGPSPASAGGPKIAFIRSQDIFAVAPGRSEAEAAFNKEVDAARAQEKAMGDSINTMITDFGKVEPTLSADVKATRAQAIRDKQAQLQQRSQQLDQQVQQKQQELVKPIMDAISKVINEIRTEQNFAMIFDAQATGGGVVAADRNLDITDQVISRLKSAAPVTPASTKPQTGPTSTPSGLSRPKTTP
jgi:outer membrane protein